MSIKKIWAMLLTVALSAGCLAGCGQTTEAEKETGSKSAESKQESSSAEAESTVVEEESAYPDYLNLDSYRPIVKEGEKVTLSVVTIRDGSNPTDISETFFVKFIEEKLNIDLEITAWSSEERDERKNIMLTSGEMPDILFNVALSNSNIVTYGIENELLLPVSDYINEELTPELYALIEEYPEIKTKFTASDGKMYSFPTISTGLPGQNGTMGEERFFFDMDALAKIGVTEVPKTLDEFLEVLRAYKEMDPESFPVVGHRSLIEQFMRTAFGWVGGGTLSATWDNAEQEIVVPVLTEKFKAYLETMHAMYEEGLLHEDYYTMDSNEMRAVAAERNSVVAADYAPYLFEKVNWKSYAAASPLSSEWNETPVSSRSQQVSDTYCYISADTEYPEVCMRLIDYLYTAEGSLYSQEGAFEGSDDTLGFPGISIDPETGSVTRAEGVTAGYDSGYRWVCDQIRIAGTLPINEAAQRSLRFETVNLSEDVGMIPDYEGNGDAHYRWSVYNATKDYLVDPLPSAYRTAEQSERYSDLSTVLNEHVNSEIAKFITGQRYLDEFDKFQEELKGMGSEEYYQLILDFYKNYTR